MTAYLIFLGVILILWVGSSPRDRNALRIILGATLFSFVLTECVTRQIHAPWKLIFPATVETLTILALLKWAKNLTGYMQAGLLVVAWAAHLACYYDLMAGTSIIYDNYETVIWGVAVGQILAFYDSARHIWNHLSIHRMGVVRPASGLSVVLQPKSGTGL